MSLIRTEFKNEHKHDNTLEVNEEDTNLSLVVRKIVLNSSAHGMFNWVDAKAPFFKYMWLAFFFISTGGCAYMAANSFMDYYSYSVVTNTEIFFEVNFHLKCIVILLYSRIHLRATRLKATFG